MSTSATLIESAAVLLAGPDLPEAIAGLARLLGAEFPLMRLGVALDQPGEPWLRVLDAHGHGSGPAAPGGARMPREGTANGMVVETGRTRVNLELPDHQEFVEERLLAANGAAVYCCVPARFGGRVLGTLNMALREAPDVDLVPLLESLGDLLGAALERDRLGSEVLRLAAALRRRGEVLAAELDRLGAVRPIAESEASRRVLREVERAAAVDLSVLLCGETGTGKEVLARHLHSVGPHSDGPFVTVNCAALPDALAESELFGVRRGAFTGAERDRAGMFELATGGTLFLDEVGDLSVTTQARLLRAVQEREVTPLGGSHPIRVDVRIVSATHRDLCGMTEEQRFREDLFHRLAAIPIRVPSLAERRDDIPALVEEFVRAACARMNRQPPSISAPLLRALAARDYPGNVRQLRNLVERAIVFSGEVMVLPEDELPSIGGAATDTEAEWPTLAEAQIAHIRATLRRTEGLVYGANGAAALLGLPPSTLKSRMERLGMS